jgi:hypothetical protein
MMPITAMNARITPGWVRSLTTVYERTLSHTTPVARMCVPTKTPGSTP